MKYLLLVLALLILIGSPMAHLSPAPGIKLSSVALSPTSVVGGNSSQGTVTLTKKAPSGGLIVALSSSQPSVASVPASVTIASGSTTGVFTVTTSTVSVRTVASISASYGGVTKTANLTLTAVDTTVPVISAVAASNITSSGATITWTTNEASDSQVEYGTTTAYGSSTVLNSTLVISHSVALSGISANTLYHYRVKSRDAAGNLATSGDFTVTTSADTTAPTISSVASSSITSSGATITWTTNETSDTQVDYGTTTAYGSSTTLNPTLVMSHNATLSGLSADTLYHYRVKSRDAAGNLATSSDSTFTTSAGSGQPVISSISAARIHPTFAEITFNTDLSCKRAQIKWGTSSGVYTRWTDSDPFDNLATSHRVTLLRLPVNTIIYYVVMATSSTESVGTSSEQSFTTQAGTEGTIFVATTGNDTTGNGTVGNPYQTLTKACAVDSAGSVIICRAGSYVASDNLAGLSSGTSWLNPTVVRAYVGETVTFTNSGNHTVYVNNAKSFIIFDGIKMQGPTEYLNAFKVLDGSRDIRAINCEMYNSGASGINLSPDTGVKRVELIDCFVHDNGQDPQFDHGIYISAGNTLVDGCIIQNSTRYEIHQFSDGANNTNNIIRNCKITGTSIFASGSGHKVYNNLWIGQCDIGYGGNTGSLYNNTIINPSGGGCIYMFSANNSSDPPGVWIIDNNILSGGQHGFVFENTNIPGQTIRNNGASGFSVSATNFANSGNTLTNNIFSGFTPAFTNAGAGDYSILSNSSAIGVALAVPALLTDRAGHLRPQNSTWDIGAYEFVP